MSFVAGLATLILTYLIGRRLFGRPVGLTAAALLLLLRLNLTPFTGLTLTDLGAIVRYDLAALPYALGAIYLLSRDLLRPRPWAIAGAGLLLGLSALTQFIGAFLLLPLAIFILTTAQPRARRLFLAAVLCLAAAMPFLPYGAYILSNWDDFRGQARAVEQLTDFFSPSFYVDNLKSEPDRYTLSTGLDELPGSFREAVRRPSARVALYVLGPLALTLALFRGRADPRRRLIALLLLALPVEFALLESTKRFVYWVIVVPFLCLALADLAAAALAWRPSTRGLRIVAAATTLIAAAVFAAEGIVVGTRAIDDARNAPSYADLGPQLAQTIEPGAQVLGDNRLWLTLGDAEPRSLHLLFYFTNPRISAHRVTDIPGAFDRVDADYLLLSPLTREILTNLTPADQAAFDDYLATHGRLATTVDYPAYGPIDVYRLSR